MLKEIKKENEGSIQGKVELNSSLVLLDKKEKK